MLGAVSLNRPRTMSTLTVRDYRTMARVLAEVAAPPGADLEAMQSVIRKTVWTLINEDPLTFDPIWFCDLIIAHLTRLQVTVPPRPEGVSPHTRVINLDDGDAGQRPKSNSPSRSAAVRALQYLKASLSGQRMQVGSC